eukprot:scaffold587_cov339-Pavlova_lutheri.AAC.10
MSDRHPKLVRDARVETVCAFLEGGTHRHAHLASSTECKFCRPVGHFQPLVLSGVRVGGILFPARTQGTHQGSRPRTRLGRAPAKQSGRPLEFANRRTFDSRFHITLSTRKDHRLMVAPFAPNAIQDVRPTRVDSHGHVVPNEGAKNRQVSCKYIRVVLK